MHRVVSIALLIGCGGGSPETPAPAPVDDKCPKVAIDAMAGQWIFVDGSKGNHRVRFEIVKKGADWEMWYVDGGFTRRVMKGVKRQTDIAFTEVPTGARKTAWDAGDGGLVRLYVEPRKQTCSLRVSVLDLENRNGKEVEKARPGFQEFLEFPQSVPFSFKPCTEPLFLGAAATDPAVASSQMAQHGGPDPGHALSEAVPVGTTSDAAADGDASCSYEMEPWFDDRQLKGRETLPAGDVKDGLRAWAVPDWYAPYSGNHHFELHRYRVCEGQDRALLGVACVEAVLQ